MKALTGELARARVVDTPETCALACRIKQDIAAVYRAAGLPYPVVPPVDTDADARQALFGTLLEELRLETEASIESAASAIERAQLTRADSREAVRRVRASRVGKKR